MKNKKPNLEEEELKCRLDERGHECPSPHQVAIPVGFHRPPTLQEQMQRYIRTEVSRQAMENGMETFEEAEDFEVGDDYDPNSPWELEFDPNLQKEIPKDQKKFVQEHLGKFDRAVSEAKKKRGRPRKQLEFEDEVPLKNSRRNAEMRSKEDDYDSRSHGKKVYTTRRGRSDRDYSDYDSED